MIMIHCSSMSFDHLFLHVSAHQDNREEFESLSQEAQLNCACDFGAKRVLLTHNPDDLPRQQQFPLEPISVWAGREKMTSDTGSSVWFHAHKNLAWKEFNAAGILPFQQFDQVDWVIVHMALTTVTRMFQVWACKQVWGIAGTNREQARWSDVTPLCPSCRQVWMKQSNMDPNLQDCIYK